MMTEEEAIAHYTNKELFPDKYLVNGNTSKMMRLPGKQEWARVQVTPAKTCRWTWNFDPRTEKKETITGIEVGVDFVPFDAADREAIAEYYERIVGASQGIMEEA